MGGGQREECAATWLWRIRDRGGLARRGGGRSCSEASSNNARCVYRGVWGSGEVTSRTSLRCLRREGTKSGSSEAMVPPSFRPWDEQKSSTYRRAPFPRRRGHLSGRDAEVVATDWFTRTWSRLKLAAVMTKVVVRQPVVSTLHFPAGARKHEDSSPGLALAAVGKLTFRLPQAGLWLRR